MRMLDTSRFQDADKYAAYLKTPAGRLRSELAWENVRRFLPRNAAKRRALDVGGGTGFASVQLALLDYEVVLLDGSEEMLRIARQQAEAGSVAGRISICHADAGQLPKLFDAESFDIVVCHNLLEYAEDPSTVVRDIAHVLRKDAVLSILARNRAGEVLKEVIKSRDWKLATGNLTAGTVADSLYGEFVRVFAPRRWAICSPAPAWKSLPNMVSACFSTTSVWKICQMQHTLKYSNWSRRLECARSSLRLRATYR